MNLNNILQRIDELLEKGLTQSAADISEIAAGTPTLIEQVYGTHSTQHDMILAVEKQVYEGALDTFELVGFRERLYGRLRSLKSDATEGRIVNLQAEARGEVFGDFIVLARKALDEGEKEVAAVLACAALKRGLKEISCRIH